MFDPVRLGADLRFVAPRSPCAGLIDFIEYGNAAFDAELMGAQKKKIEMNAQFATWSASHPLGVGVGGTPFLD